MEYAKVGSVEYIINEKLSFENGQVISDAIATLRADNAKLREVLNKIRMIASCAPHDDEELASQEFTTIMNEARRVLEETNAK